MCAGLAAKDPVLVLHRQHIDLIDVQVIRRPLVRARVTLGNLEPDAGRIRVPSAGIVNREHEGVDVRHGCRQGIGEVRRERGDAALPRQMVAEYGESFHFRGMVTRYRGSRTILRGPTGDGCSLLNSRTVEKAAASLGQTPSVRHLQLGTTSRR